MNITATHINYYQICHRKLWLFSNGILMEHTSETVADGKLLHETSYLQRPAFVREIALSATLNKEIELTGKIDFYDPKNKIIHETKRSKKIEKAHIWQVKFYLWLLKLNGIEEATATLEYPLIRKTDLVTLNAADIAYLEKITLLIAQLKTSDQCPPVIKAKLCKNCSYYEFCYAGDG